MQTSTESIKSFIYYLKSFKNYSDHTCKSYERDLIHFYHFFKLEKQSLCDIKRKHAQQYLFQLHQEQLSNKSIARKLSSLRSFWTYLIHKKQSQENPWKLLNTPKISYKLPKILAKERMKKFLDGLPLIKPIDYRNKAICELLYSSGLRVSELCAIKLNDIKWPQNEIIILGKGQQERWVIFSEACKKHLEAYLKQYQPYWRNQENNALFINKWGAPLCPRSIQRILKAASINQKIYPPLTPHSLRHCFATDLYEGGADISCVQELLGHQSLNTTQLYTHLSTQHLQKVVNKSHPRSTKK